MWRNVLGVVVGGIVWMVGFFALARLLFPFWPDYATVAREFMRDGVFNFTSGMAWFNVLFWALAGMLAGWVTMKLAQRRGAVWALAGVLASYLALMHIVLFWDRYPWWYNLAVVIPAIPAVLLGGRFAIPMQHIDGRSL